MVFYDSRQALKLFNYLQKNPVCFKDGAPLTQLHCMTIDRADVEQVRRSRAGRLSQTDLRRSLIDTARTVPALPSGMTWSLRLRYRWLERGCN